MLKCWISDSWGPRPLTPKADLQQEARTTDGLGQLAGVRASHSVFLGVVPGIEPRASNMLGSMLPLS